MFRRSFLRAFAVVALAGLTLGLSTGLAQEKTKRGRKFKAPPATARIEVTIVRDTDSKPLENASVIFHPMVGEKDEGNMELKTNEDGKTMIDVIPIGDTVRLQVIAKGYQTYGQDYKIEKPEMALEVRVKRPGEQYSIYKMHEKKPSTENSSEQPKPQN